ncbi:MAG TPA: hypothetical protein VGR12_06465 [Solirubrobacteraceae bacterium]|nr:hypothetical protein [Solirubrobacteraceae bacterium]
MRRLFPLLMLLAAVAAPAGLAAGCGSDDLPSISAADAAQATRDAHTARTTMRVEMTGMGLPRPITVTGEGVTATDAPQMNMTFELGDLLPGGETHLVLDGARLYAQLPQGGGFELPGGASWVRLDLARMVAALGIEPRGLREVFRMTPQQQLESIQAAGSMKEVGEEEIDGVRTTHLRGTLTLRDYARTLPAERRAELRRAIRQIAELTGEEPEALDEPTPTELWVDEDAHVRRMVQSSKVPAQEGMPPGSIKIAVEFDDFGAALDVDPPAGDDVYDATRMLVRELR